MQPPAKQPTLGDDFGELCESDLVACLRRLLDVSAKRSKLYYELEAKHKSLVEFAENVASDNNSLPRGSRGE